MKTLNAWYSKIFKVVEKAGIVKELSMKKNRSGKSPGSATTWILTHKIEFGRNQRRILNETKKHWHYSLIVTLPYRFMCLNLVSSW